LFKRYLKRVLKDRENSAVALAH